MTLIADVFPILQTPKNVADQCLESPVSEDTLKSKMKNAPKYLEIWMIAPLPYLLSNVKKIDQRKVSFSDIQNLKTSFLIHWVSMAGSLFLIQTI